MRPYPEEVIQALQRGVASHFFPELTSAYAQAQFMPAQILFGVALRDFDAAAQNLLDANRELRSLLEQVAAALALIEREDARSARELSAMLPAPSADVRLASLRAEFDGLRDIFCKLAPLIEPASADPELVPLAAVRREVYAWFSADAKKRTVPILNN